MSHHYLKEKKTREAESRKHSFSLIKSLDSVMKNWNGLKSCSFAESYNSSFFQVNVLDPFTLWQFPIEEVKEVQESQLHSGHPRLRTYSLTRTNR